MLALSGFVAWSDLLLFLGEQSSLPCFDNYLLPPTGGSPPKGGLSRLKAPKGSKMRVFLGPKKIGEHKCSPL